MLSVILTAAVLFPDLGEGLIFGVLGGGGLFAFLAWGVLQLRGQAAKSPIDRSGKASWRMLPVDLLPPRAMTLAEKMWMGVLRGYLVLAGGLVLVRILQLAFQAAH